MKYLLVGDMHVQKDNLEESRRLISWTNAQCIEHEATPIFLGDQHHSMGVVRTEVIEFWDWAFRQFKGSLALTGNHDLSSDGQSSAMTAHKEVTGVVDHAPLRIEQSLYAIGYIRDNDLFTQVCLKAYNQGARTIICHSEFQGAQFESGFYTQHGVDLARFPKDLLFISGHIHKKQQIIGPDGEFKVLYIGTPRMLTRSDIGETKRVTVMDTDSGMFTDIPVPYDVVEPFQYIKVEEGKPLPEILNSPKVYVDVMGSTDFIKKTCPKLPELAKVRSLPKEESHDIEIKESEGISTAFLKYAFAYGSEKQLEPSYLREVINSIHARCPLLKAGG